MTTGYARYTTKTPYYWDAKPKHPWSAIDVPTDGHTPPFYHQSDRQVAAVEWHNVTQGVYVCANGGKCIAPDQCQCAAGWMGFDCRTPICSQGYHVAAQERFVSGTKTTDELKYFEPFMSQFAAPGGEAQELLGLNTSLRLDWEYSNPNYTMHWEYFLNKTHRATEVRHHGNERYLSPSGQCVGQSGALYWTTKFRDRHDSEQNVLFGGHTLGDLTAINKGVALRRLCRSTKEGIPSGFGKTAPRSTMCSLSRTTQKTTFCWAATRRQHGRQGQFIRMTTAKSITTSGWRDGLATVKKCGVPIWHNCQRVSLRAGV